MDLILGTAGHIDHGKTALVKALTGVDTDRLPEEKRRGITIDLGFAEMPLGPHRLGIVDVPGHERFVRNMLAGATGIDLALLVVAADDSVKPQTREHLQILRLLDLEAGVIALTKCDLPEPAWIDLVEQEVRELVSGTFLAGAPLVRTSALTGLGLDRLRAALAEAADNAAGSARVRNEGGPFRMAIDRAFTLAGHGTVVTGSVSSGRARVGDELRIEPGGLPARVRGLENHGRPVDEVRRGQRAAVNVAGVHHQEIGRGQALAAPGHLAPSRLLTARLELLPSAPRPVKHRARARLHIGTAELLASVALLDRDELLPGDAAPAQLALAAPAAVVWGQPFVVRSESPVVTIGGGHVLEPGAPRRRRRQPETLALLAALVSDDPDARASAAVELTGWRPWAPADLARTAGIGRPETVYGGLVARGTVLELALSPTRVVRVHRSVLADLAARIEATLARMHDESPLSPAVERASLAGRFHRLGDPAIVEAVLAWMQSAGRIEASERGIALPGRGPRLSARDRELLAWIVETYREAGFQPPSVDQLRARAAPNQAAVPKLIALAVAEGQLVKVSSEFYLHAQNERRMRDLLAARLSGGPGVAVGEVREMLGTTRKYAVPLCEYLDRVGFTRREGDLRVLAARP